MTDRSIQVPRRQPQLLPGYMPASSQLVFGSSQGVSLVSLLDGGTVRFWGLAGGGDASNGVYPAPQGEARVVVAAGDGLYYLPRAPGE